MTHELANATSKAPLVRVEAVRTEWETHQGTPILPSPLSHGDYVRLKQGFTRYRDLLMCQMLFGTGLRIAELLRLTPREVIREGPEVYILVKRGKKRGKAGWERVPLHPELGVALQGFIQGNRVGLTESVFGVTARQVQRIFRDVGKRALGRPVHPHHLRKLYAKMLLDAGLPAPAAAKMLGHEDSRTTEKWYYDLTMEQRMEIQRRLPV